MQRLQNGLLITASYFLFIHLVLTLLISYLATLIIYLLTNVATNWLSSRWIYGILTAVIVGFFTTFKYYSFFKRLFSKHSINLVLVLVFPILEILAPRTLILCIPFGSYTVSVCRKEIPKADFFDVTLYLAFFRASSQGQSTAKNFLPQIQAESREVLDPRKILLISLALVKLFLFSSYLSENFVNPVFDSPWVTMRERS